MAMREVLAFPFATSLRGSKIRIRDAVMLSSGIPAVNGRVQSPSGLARFLFEKPSASFGTV
jgi:hypothetical protein